MAIETFGKRDVIRLDLAPAYKALVDEAIPLGHAARAVAAGAGIALDAPDRNALGKTPSVRYLNKQKAEDGILQPGPSKAWETADQAMAYRPTANQWCEGALFLFAAAHYDEFARTLVAAREDHLPPRRKLEMVEAVATAVRPTASFSTDELRAQLAADGFSDLLIRGELNKIKKGTVLQRRRDREVWHLSSQERLSLHQAFVSSAEVPLSRPYEIAVATAQLAAKDLRFGIDMSADITVAALRLAFSRA